MAHTQAGTILRHIRSLVDIPSSKDLTDAELLHWFVAHREEAAFARLVERHGRLVWGVCKHFLHQEQDAEDAFQATFLVLARRAGSIRKAMSVGSWLYGVAYKVAMKAKHRSRRQKARERQTKIKSPTQPPSDLAWRELQAVLDEELQHLPEKYRSPFVLCCLEGRTRKEVCQELGCEEGTISSRIGRARRLLQARLIRRGVTLASVLCAYELWKQSATAVPMALQWSALQAADGSATGLSASSLALADSATRMLWLSKWQIGGYLLLAFALVGTVTRVASQHLPAKPQTEEKSEVSSAIRAPIQRDMHGDPLPPGALARLGTWRQRAPGTQIAVTADGKEIVTVGPEMTVRRFDALTGELRATRQLPPVHSYPLIRLSPHGTFVLANLFLPPSGYQLELWDTAQGQRRWTIPIPRHVLWGAELAEEDTCRVALADGGSGPETQRILIWHPETARLQVLWCEAKQYRARYFEPFVRLSADGKRAVGCHLDQFLRCWKVEDGTLLWQAQEKTWKPFAFFSPDGRTVVSSAKIGVEGTTVRDAATGDWIKGRNPLPREAIYPMGFSPDGRFLAFENNFEDLLLWEPASGKTAFQLPRPECRRNTDPFMPNEPRMNLAFTPDSKALIRRSGALQRWDLVTGQPVYENTESWGHTEEVSRLVFSPDGRFLASSSKDRTARIWDVATTHTLRSFPTGGSNHLAFTADGRHLLTLPFGLGNKALCRWNVTNGREEEGLELADPGQFRWSSNDKELRATPDGKKIVILTWKNGRTSDESILTVWNAVTRECLVHRRVPWGEDSLFTPDCGHVLALDSRTGRVRLLAVDTEKSQVQFQTDQLLDEQVLNEQVSALGCNLALSPNGRVMAARVRLFHRNKGVYEDSAIRLGDMATGRQLLKLQVAGRAAFAFSSNDALFAIASQDGLRFWEVASGKEIGRIQVSDWGPSAPSFSAPLAIAFSPDGRTLATGHADSTILLWDVSLRGGMPGRPLTAADAEACWADLASPNAAEAYAAVWRLVDDAKRSIPLLQERVKPVKAPASGKLGSLLKDLDSDQFKVRQAATKELQKLGERVEPALREALMASPSLEKRQRIEALFAARDPASPLSGDALRGVRAVQVLERISSQEARQILRVLAHGVESAYPTRAAREALKRLGESP